MYFLKKAILFFTLTLAIISETYATKANKAVKSPPATLYGTEIPYDLLQPLKQIFLEAKKKNWTKAAELLRTPALTKNAFWQNAYKWYYLTSDDTQPLFVEFQTFLPTNNDWPETEKIRKRAELALVREKDSLTDETILKWFNHFKPQTAKGRLIYINLLQKTQKIKEAHQEIQNYWHLSDLTKEEESEFLTNFKDDLNHESHLNRAQRLMDENKKEALQRLFNFLPPHYRALYETRLSIPNSPDHIHHLLKILPEKVENDPGLLMQVLSWYHAKGFNDEAQKILMEYKPLSQYQEKWENIRRIQSREVMKEKRYSASYELAVRHSFQDGEKYADFEWFAGWIALEYLKDPKRALQHFMNHLKTVKSNMSLSRSYYWLARTYEALGHQNEAKNYYHQALNYGWTFYGQLAAQQIGQKPNLRPIKTALIPESLIKFTHLAQLLHQIDEDDKASTFIFYVNKNLKEGGQHLSLSYFAKKIGITKLAVRLARDAQNKQPGIAVEAYPKLELISKLPIVQKEQLDPALIHSVILQESRYDPKAVSTAGARGYMQLMPDTAKRIAAKNKIPYQINKLTDPNFNITIGSSYLKNLLEAYNDFYPITLAAYNAGPEPLERWRREFGDPLNKEDKKEEPKTNIINWIESITYGETRNYVQRVLENLYIYRHVHQLNMKNNHDYDWWQNWQVLK